LFSTGFKKVIVEHYLVGRFIFCTFVVLGFRLASDCLTNLPLEELRAIFTVRILLAIPSSIYLDGGKLVNEIKSLYGCEEPAQA
jgi:hypothetical protein